ncbi:hypothetical protein [Vibrio algicola]|uniref:Uncharacterized protein n=1 Tax=Vibrio algicola TaxID=2662262 RepID=A0A5Q0TDA6_9VIBR|nr:hypothetical protein [Vibrio algicola]
MKLTKEEADAIEAKYGKPESVVNGFPHYPSNRTKTKLTHGHGLNDADYMTRINVIVGGKNKVIWEPAYAVWRSMMQRAYDPKFHQRSPTYVDVTVHEAWRTFSNFEAWHQVNAVDGFELDKDILKINNKIYAPEYCVFIPQAINSLLLDSGAARGSLPQGVSFSKGCKSKSYLTNCSINGKIKHIGRFQTPTEAALEYWIAKFKIANQTMNAHGFDINSRVGRAVRKRLLAEIKKWNAEWIEIMPMEPEYMEGLEQEICRKIQAEIKKAA